MLILSGFLIALLSYALFALGITGFFYKPVILGFVFSWFLIVLCIFYIKFKQRSNNTTLKILLSSPFLYLLLVQIIVNLMGALGPELAFDSLWYHLTIPKIYLQLHRVVFIPGNLLYYSAMPKLVEILFAAGLALGSESFAKLIHFTFGILSLLVIYKIARRQLFPKMSVVACVIFYSNLLVGWESITAYVDLGRVFFELLALLSVLDFYKTKKMKWVIISGFMIGFAVATKLLAGFSMLILLFCINFVLIRYFNEIRKIISANIVYILSVVVVLFPWLFFAYLNTGNPFFPLFSNYLKSFSFTFNISNFFGYFWNLFVSSNDPISPIYLITLPLIPFIIKKLHVEAKIILYYSLGGIILSSFVPYGDSARYTLPYLAGFSVFQLHMLSMHRGKVIAKVGLFLIVVFSLFSIFYRGVANAKYIAVVVGIESKNDFLSHNLNFSFGDFYDINGDIKNKVGDNKVLIFGVHNLFYADFDYIHESWLKRGDKVKYILVQDGNISEEFSNSNIIYKNTLTHVKLYSNKSGEWIY